MAIMTRMGRPALERIARDGQRSCKGLHSIGELDPNRRFIMHFPEELSIESFGSGYGGNALLGKKCHALRIASWQARDEGWLAEHMLIVGIENPQGETHYIACGVPVGLRQDQPRDADSARNPCRAGRSGPSATTSPGCIPARTAACAPSIPKPATSASCPGTNRATNRNAFDMIHRDTLFTNVALTADNEPVVGRQQARRRRRSTGRADPSTRRVAAAAHPNSRFTVSAKHNPIYSPRSRRPAGVPISAHRVRRPAARSRAAGLRGPRLGSTACWSGASVASETTAAATGAVGVVRRDPMAMKPFCGYNFGDYWAHWLDVGKRSKQPPRMFHVNWFRRDAAGKFLWPGFGDNLRVLEWILKRCAGPCRGQRYADRLPAEAGGPECQGAGHQPRTAAGTARVKPACLAQGSRGYARVPEGVRPAHAAGDVRGTRRRSKSAWAEHDMQFDESA